MSSRSTPLTWLSRHAALLAAACFLVAVLGFGLALDGYSQRAHPVGLLGARTIPGGWGFNLLAFIVPGVLLAWQAWRLRDALDHHGHRVHAVARVGAQMLQLSALAFAAQGVLPLDPTDLHNPVSARHAAAWMIWWLSFAVGGTLLGIGLVRRLAWRHFAAVTLLVAIALPLCALKLPQVLEAGWAQRVGLLLWFAWALACARELNRTVASSPGLKQRG
jgi:hypothetical protein